MNGRFGRVIRNPRAYLKRTPKFALRQLSGIFANTSFFLQGQMDLNSRSFWYSSELVRQYGGYTLCSEKVARHVTNLEPWDNVRRDMLILLLRSLNEREIPGEMAELGVFKGLTAKLIHHYMPDRKLHLFDTFCGFDTKDKDREAATTGIKLVEGHFADTSVEGVRAYIQPQNENLEIHSGFFPDSIPAGCTNTRFSFVHLDADLYQPILAGLTHFYPRMSRGGLIVIHDYNAWVGARRAVEEFFSDLPETPLPMPDKSGSAVIVKL